MNQKSTRGVQQDEVSAAADALLAERLRPTIERVRMKIGRGSPNTVAPMLEAWFADLGSRLGVVPAEEGEGGPPPALRQAMESLWAAARAAAREEGEAGLAHERKALDADREQLRSAQDDQKRQRAEMGEREAALGETLSIAKGQLEQQTQQLARLQVDLEQRDRDLAETRSSLAGLVQKRDSDRRRFDEQLQAHTKERERAHERAAATERRLLEEVDRARQEAKHARAGLEDVERRHRAAQESAQKTQELLAGKYAAAQIELASFKELLAARVRREADLLEQLEMQRAATAAVVSKLGEPRAKTSSPRPNRQSGRRPAAKTRPS
jgi:chromosome segregation ATPase